MVVHGSAGYCIVMNYLALSCTILHIRYSCSQQMSPVIAFDIAVVAQKVKVHVVIEDRCDLKKWVVVVYH